MTASDRGSSGSAPPPLVYLARRALRFWRPAAVVFALLVVGTLLFARQTWQPYQSQAVLMFDTALPRDMATVGDPIQTGGRVKELLFATDRIRNVVTKFDLFPEYSTQQAIEETKKRLDFQVQAGGTFAITYVGFSPAQAQAVLRELTETLLVDHNQRRSREVKQTREFLEAELKKLEEDVRARETTLKDFLAKHPEAASIADQNQLTDPSTLVLEQQLGQLRAQARTRPAGGGAAATSTAEIVEAKRNAEAERDKAFRELQDKLATLTEAHPDVIAAKERHRGAQADVNRYAKELQQASTAAGGSGNPEDLEIKSLEMKLAGIRSASRSRRNKDPKTLQLEVQLQDLRHNLEEARKRVSSLENEKVQASVMEKMDSSGNFERLRVHDPATLPGSPLQSRRRRVAMGGFFLACVLAAGMAFGRAMVSDRIFDRTDVAHLAGVPVLASIPPVPKRWRNQDE
jgi:uncharacterized protein involved in exopolysaccharide biosynthesis